MSTRAKKFSFGKHDVFRAECIHAVLVAQRHLAEAVPSAADLRGYGTDDDDYMFTLSRVALDANRPRGAAVEMQVRVCRETKTLVPPPRAAFILGQLGPDADDAARTQAAWAACLRIACAHGASGYAFKFGDRLVVRFARVAALRSRPAAEAPNPGPVPVADRLDYDAATVAALYPPDWQRLKQRGSGHALAIWAYCIAYDGAMDQKVARVREAYECLYGLKTGRENGGPA